MNVCLEDAVFIDQKGLQYRVDNFAVRPRQIAYIQLPNNVSLMTIILRASSVYVFSRLNVLIASDKAHE